MHGRFQKRQLEKYPATGRLWLILKQKIILFSNTIHSVFLGRKINVCLGAKLKTRQSPNNQYKFWFL